MPSNDMGCALHSPHAPCWPLAHAWEVHGSGSAHRFAAPMPSCSPAWAGCGVHRTLPSRRNLVPHRNTSSASPSSPRLPGAQSSGARLQCTTTASARYAPATPPGAPAPPVAPLPPACPGHPCGCPWCSDLLAPPCRLARSSGRRGSRGRCGRRWPLLLLLGRGCQPGASSGRQRVYRQQPLPQLQAACLRHHHNDHVANLEEPHP